MEQRAIILHLVLQAISPHSAVLRKTKDTTKKILYFDISILVFIQNKHKNTL